MQLCCTLCIKLRSWQLIGLYIHVCTHAAGYYQNVGRILYRKGLAYTQLKEHAMALEMFTQYLGFTKEIEDRVEEVCRFCHRDCSAILIIAIVMALSEI